MPTVLQVRDVRAAEHWYAALGIVAGKGSAPDRVLLDVGGTPIILEPAHVDLAQFYPLSGAVVVEVEAADIERFHGQVIASGAVITQSLTKRMTDGRRTFSFADPSGYRFRVIAR